jgi:hypothetical protein
MTKQIDALLLASSPASMSSTQPHLPAKINREIGLKQGQRDYQPVASMY